MYALNLSQDGKNYRAYFQNGRLRRYDTIPKSINAAKQLINNPKNKMHTIIVYDISTNYSVAFVTNHFNGFSSVEYCKQAPNKLSSEKKVSIEELIDKPNKQVDRVQLLKDLHKQYLDKKKNKKPLKPGNSINNLSTSKLKKEDSFYEDFMAVVIKQSINSKDPRTLCSTERKLSQRGYSWYVDNEGEIQVKPTEQVIEWLNEQEYV